MREIGNKFQLFKNLCKNLYIYWNDLDKASFQHDMAYGSYNDSVMRTESDKVLRDEGFQIASNPRYDGYEWELALMV